MLDQTIPSPACSCRGQWNVKWLFSVKMLILWQLLELMLVLGAKLGCSLVILGTVQLTICNRLVIGRVQSIPSLIQRETVLKEGRHESLFWPIDQQGRVCHWVDWSIEKSFVSQFGLQWLPLCTSEFHHSCSMPFTFSLMMLVTISILNLNLCSLHYCIWHCTAYFITVCRSWHGFSLCDVSQQTYWVLWSLWPYFGWPLIVVLSIQRQWLVAQVGLHWGSGHIVSY